jgi:hypothetical protein
LRPTCALDYRRTVAVSENRREQRLAIPADLHGFVAPHVTGILVRQAMIGEGAG